MFANIILFISLLKARVPVAKGRAQSTVSETQSNTATQLLNSASADATSLAKKKADPKKKTNGSRKKKKPVTELMMKTSLLITFNRYLPVLSVVLKFNGKQLLVP